MNLYFYIFLIIIISLMGVSSNSWWVVFLSMELNNFLLMPMLMSYSKMSNSYLMKSKLFMYFMIQVVSSSLFFLGMLLNMNTVSFIGLLLKTGSFPFFIWMLKIIENLDWICMFVLVVLMKIVPLCVIDNMKVDMKNVMILLSIGSIILIYSLNLGSMRMILTFSGFVHMAWMINISFSSKYLLILYYMIYLMNLIFIIYSMNSMNISSLCYSIVSVNKNSMSSILILLLIVMMCGIPPSLGFIPKLIFVSYSLNESSYLEMFILLILSLMSFYIYFKVMIFFMIYNVFSNNSFMLINTNFEIFMTFFIMLFSFISLMLFM